MTNTLFAVVRRLERQLTDAEYENRELKEKVEELRQEVGRLSLELTTVEVELKREVRKMKKERDDALSELKKGEP